MAGAAPISFLGEEIAIFAGLQQQILDHDRLLLQHVTAEITERRKLFWRGLMASVEEEVRKRLKAKDEEIETARKLSWALEERVRSLCIENQIWRELAQSNEATANLLRANLEQILCAKEDGERCADPADAAGDAESCCCGENDSLSVRVCRSCTAREPTVLLLPCRHLCICGLCCSAISACPICNCATNGTVNVTKEPRRSMRCNEWNAVRVETELG